MKRFWYALLCVFILTAMTACGQSTPETAAQTASEAVPAPESTTETASEAAEPAAISEKPQDIKQAPSIYINKVYSLNLPTEEDPNHMVQLNEQGNILENITIPTPLYDALTGELRYYTVMEHEPDGSLKASWLYDTKGRAIEGSGSCIYREGFGRFVVRTLREETPGGDAEPAGVAVEFSQLYDPETKTATAENVFFVERLTGKRAVCLDAKRGLLGVYDPEGEKLSEIPAGETFTCGYCCGGYILGYPESGCAILNEDLETVETAPKMFDMDLLDCGAQGVICIKKENNVCQIYRVDDWKLRGTFPADLQTTDGINVICGDDFSKEVNLHGIRGRRVAGPYDKISLLRDENDMLMGMVLARKDNAVYVLNKYGNIVAQRKISGLTRAYCTFDGLIMCEYGFKNDWTGAEETGYALLEQRLKWVSSRDYNFVKLERAAKGIYSGTRQNGENSFRTDLFNEAGEVIFKRVMRLGTADEFAIAVCDKDRFGLISHSGSWIAEYDLPEKTEF